MVATLYSKLFKILALATPRPLSQPVSQQSLWPAIGPKIGTNVSVIINTTI